MTEKNKGGRPRVRTWVLDPRLRVQLLYLCCENLAELHRRHLVGVVPLQRLYLIARGEPDRPEYVRAVEQLLSRIG